MRALTLYPEHAELFRLRLRTIETRSKPTKYRGPLLLHAGVRDEHSAAAQRSPRTRAALGVIPHGDPLTRGAVVASCQLVDCVPIYDGEVAHDPLPTRPLIYRHNPDRLTYFDADVGSDADAATLDDQRPFGDFSPGRYAWLLGDVKPTTERCPRCWGFGTLAAFSDHPPDSGPCPICNGDTRSAPVPMRGRQGLWIPTEHDWLKAAA